LGGGDNGDGGWAGASSVREAKANAAERAMGSFPFMGYSLPVWVKGEGVLLCLMLPAILPSLAPDEAEEERSGFMGGGPGGSGWQGRMAGELTYRRRDGLAALIPEARP